MSNIIDGQKIAADIRAEIKGEVDAFIDAGKRAPGLGVILVGDNPASQTYVASKAKAAHGCGFHTVDKRFSEACTREELHLAIDELNADPQIDGILLQLPLPRHLNQDEFIRDISPAKDADGLHPFNQGLLLQGKAVVKPCTPFGVIELLHRTGVSCAGKKAIVIGRSILVGKPLSLLLLEENATVVMAHSRTEKLPELVSQADIVVAALGVPNFVKGEWLKEGAVVIDVGINRLADGSLVGDAEFSSCSPRASHITPVPKGVGPMTIAMLLRNTFDSYKRTIK